MDYAFAHACKLFKHNPAIMALYDIICQWFINLRKRANGNPHLSAIEQMTILRAIGLWHVHGHKKECFGRFSPSLIQGAGMIDGEVVETLWAKLNEISGSIRGMTKAHRQEVLDMHMNDSNWNKSTKMGRHCEMFIAPTPYLLRHSFCSPPQVC